MLRSFETKDKVYQWNDSDNHDHADVGIDKAVIGQVPLIFGRLWDSSLYPNQAAYENHSCEDNQNVSTQAPL